MGRKLELVEVCSVLVEFAALVIERKLSLTALYWLETSKFGNAAATTALLARIYHTEARTGTPRPSENCAGMVSGAASLLPNLFTPKPGMPKAACAA